jgi:hypothetical protein
VAPAAADDGADVGVAGDDAHASRRRRLLLRRRRPHLEAGHGELADAVAESSIIPNQCKEPNTEQAIKEKGEAKLMEITGAKRDGLVRYIQQPAEISQKSLGIFPPHFPSRALCFFDEEAKLHDDQRREKQKRRAKLLPDGAGAGSNWVDQGRQEPKKRPWYRIDFF